MQTPSFDFSFDDMLPGKMVMHVKMLDGRTFRFHGYFQFFVSPSFQKNQETRKPPKGPRKSFISQACFTTLVFSVISKLCVI